MQNTAYSPFEIERRHYENWETKGYFRPHMQPNTPSFAIQLPPPNVTGTLHMGHAFNQTIMDTLIRYERMSGKNTCWIPGTDHAGIATQIVVERQLGVDNVSRHDLGRVAFLDKVWQWKQHSGGTITEQMRRVGCSADWSREYFTMDETRAKVVNEVFVQLYEQGLIYRGKRLVNWDPVLGTAVSDLEVESVEETGSMWHIRYPLVNNPNEFVIIATTRPETLLGDVAVAVNPNDERYLHLIGQELILPLTGRTIPVIADAYVDQDFGTGCVKITPAHDFNDYEVGKRHRLPLVSVFDLHAHVVEQASVFDCAGNEKLPIKLPEKYAGLERFAARKAMVADLEAGGFLVEAKAHVLMTPKGDRTGSVIEPMLTSQWFVAMNEAPKFDMVRSQFQGLSLAEKAKKAVASGQVRFVPENWVNTYNRWMDNIQDWCISRQLWWGHQIPAWYDESGNIYVAKSYEEAQKLAPDAILTRDNDVLDTWFSSALVPFSTLGWPEETPELKAFLPSSVLVTGYEIIFFWVARMIMMSTHFTGSVPFKDVYIHGMVLDYEGKKMSKSEGNVIDPVDLIEGIELDLLLEKRTTGLRRPEKAPQVIEKTKKEFPNGIPPYGADAVRLTMASYASLGRSINFDFKRAEGYRHFCNKLWNASYFVMMNAKEHAASLQVAPELLAHTFVDMWILSRLEQTKAAMAEAFRTYRLDLAVQHLYEFVWNEYCDWYIELAKVQIQTMGEAHQQATRHTLVKVLEEVLRLAHPLIPFITEELWQRIAPLASVSGESVMLAAYPVADEKRVQMVALERMLLLQEMAGVVRNLRAQMGLSPGIKVPLLIETSSDLHDIVPYLPSLTRLSNVECVGALPENEDAPVAVCRGVRLMLKVEVDREAEVARLTRAAEKLQKSIDKIVGKLERPGYVDKAPAALVEKDRTDLAELNAKMGAISQQLKKFE